MRLHVLFLLLVIAIPSAVFAGPRALFDNAHAETAGNADWVIDNDQPIPVPDQSGITAGSPFTYWTGAISSWGVSLVKRGYTVHTNTTALTYGSDSNPYDLSKYDVLIVDEPNTLFSASETTAIFNFVANGGGLIAVVDHDGSDRNNDGFDSPKIWNALDPSHLFGVHSGSTGDASNNIVQTSTNVNPSASDSVTHGPVGTVGGLAYHNGTTFTLYPGTNPTVRGEVWMTGLSQSSTTGLMSASAVYGNGRVVFVGDSSPADDGTANSGNINIFDGWGESAGGATDSTLFMNATLWATRRSAPGDNLAPTVTLNTPNGGETWKAGSTHAITWSASDNVGVTLVDLAYSTDGGATFPSAIASGANIGSFSWVVPDVPGGDLRVRATAHDAASNSASDASDASFTIDLWQITASAGAGGSITPSDSIGVVEGAAQGFAIASAQGFRIADVVVDGGSAGALASWSFTGVNANHTISASFADSTSPAVQVMAPNGGESFTLGDTAIVTWNAGDADPIAGVDLLLSRAGPDGPFETLASGIANDGAEPWVVTGPATSDAWLEVVAHDAAGNSGQDLSNAAFAIQDVVAGAGDQPVRDFGIESAWPNPARGSVSIGLAAPRATRARLSIVDLQGREVARLFDGTLEAGRRTVSWSAGAGRAPLPTGLYWVRLSGPGLERTRRLALVR